MVIMEQLCSNFAQIWILCKNFALLFTLLGSNVNYRQTLLYSISQPEQKSVTLEDTAVFFHLKTQIAVF